MRPIQHPFEFRGVLHVAFKRGQEDLRGVGEDDDAETYGEIGEVETPLHFGPAPVSDLQETVGEDYCVDEDVRHGAPKRQQAHAFQ